MLGGIISINQILSIIKKGEETCKHYYIRGIAVFLNDVFM